MILLLCLWHTLLSLILYTPEAPWKLITEPPSEGMSDFGMSCFLIFKIKATILQLWALKATGILSNMEVLNSSLIRRKSESQNGRFKKTKHAKFSEKTNISYTPIRARTWAYQGVRNFRFFGRFGVLRFLETPVLRLGLLPYYRRNIAVKIKTLWKLYVK